MTKRSNLLIWTCADEAYEHFIPVFAWCALSSNPNARVAVGIAENSDVESREAKTLDHVWRTFPNRFELIRLPESSFSFAARRFIDVPDFSTEYIYITDVDIFMTQSATAAHLPQLERFEMPFSNALRPRSNDVPRLTGLHFSQSLAMADAIERSRTLLLDPETPKLNDENLLYQMISQLGFDLEKLLGAYRPDLGFHLSLYSRFPAGYLDASGSRKPAWGGDVRGALDICKDKEFRDTLSANSKFLLALLEMFDFLRKSRFPVERIPMLSGGAIMSSMAQTLPVKPVVESAEAE